METHPASGACEARDGRVGSVAFLVPAGPKVRWQMEKYLREKHVFLRLAEHVISHVFQVTTGMLR